MSFKELQTQIFNMLQFNFVLVEVYFLSYMNNFRVKEYCTAVYNFFYCFDRNINFTDVNFVNKTVEEDVSRRYVLLNLAGFFFRFGYKEEVLVVLQEAIRMVQEINDYVCLQYVFSWFYRIEDAGNVRTVSLIVRFVDKSEEMLLLNIIFFSVQALVKYNVFFIVRLFSVIEYMLKSDILNC